MKSVRFIAGLVALIFLAGCNQAPPATPIVVESNRPASVAEGVATLSSLRDTIKAAFDAGTPHECDDALHEAADIVTQLASVAGDEGMRQESMTVVETESKNLFQQFMKIHEGFHAEGEATTEGNAYDSVADAITTSLEALQGAVDAEATAETPDDVK